MGGTGRRNQLESEREEEETDGNSPRYQIFPHGRDRVVHFENKPEFLPTSKESSLMTLIFWWCIFPILTSIYRSFFPPDFQETIQTFFSDINYNFCTRGIYHGDNGFFIVFPQPFHIYRPKGTRADQGQSYLTAYLEQHNPSLSRGVFPRLHHLPNILQTKHASWSGKQYAINTHLSGILWRCIRT